MLHLVLLNVRNMTIQSTIKREWKADATLFVIADFFHSVAQQELQKPFLCYKALLHVFSALLTNLFCILADIFHNGKSGDMLLFKS